VIVILLAQQGPLAIFSLGNVSVEKALVGDSAMSVKITSMVTQQIQQKGIACNCNPNGVNPEKTQCDRQTGKCFCLDGDFCVKEQPRIAAWCVVSFYLLECFRSAPLQVWICMA